MQANTHRPSQPQLLTLLQVRLLKKLGRNAYPFTFSLNRGLPSSVSLQPGQGEADKPCGVDFILRCFIGKLPEDKIEKRNSVRLAIKKITHAPEEQTQRPTTDVSKDFMLSSHPLLVEANLDKGTYSHGEPIKVNISIANRSSKTVKKIRVQVRQFASICLFAQSEYKCVVAQVDSDDGFPVHAGGALQKTYEMTPLLSDNRDKRGLALDGQIKHEDTCLASSTILPEGVVETRETREKMGIMVHYNVKVRCVVSFGKDLTLELPFTLTNPKPAKPVISQMVTLPYKSPAGKTSEGGDGGGGEGGEKKGEGEEGKTAADGAEEAKVNGEMENAMMSQNSVHDLIDHNLITFDAEHEAGEGDADFVFEEFVRLRVAGLMEESNETDA
ncbi:Beta-arrestin-2 [Geodia barretti]|uniref:Beta-arrestin-2 n=2 Tax=Geodia barretti TaxID=519541 RepID=A0AA35XBB6_GEOBA|nr:Beta-arrestin-2 [Geodia barretti]